MELRIEAADFADARLARFLDAHLRDTEPTAPPESRHALDLEQLQTTGIRMWVAMSDDRLVGTIALAPVSAIHAEIKSMRTEPDLRRRGIGSLLLVHAIEDAWRRGLRRLSLETGSVEFFAPARSLYAKHGFILCPPFGEYVEDPYSLFMTRELASGPD